MALAAVRAAAIPDVDEIVRIQARTWALAYAELVPATAIEQLAGEGARDAWAGAVDAGEGRHVLVATEGDWTVGFCAAAVVAPPSGPDAAGPWGEIGVLLVEPRWGRRGHGGRLLASVADALRRDGALFGVAWVPERDEASRRFYARVGWEPDGAVRALDTGDGRLHEIRLTGPLTLHLH